MGFNEALLHIHVATFVSFFFLMGVMLRLFALSPWELRRGLVLGAAQAQAPRF